MFLKVKIGMAEFFNPGLILVAQIHAGKPVMFQKLWKILVTLICISPMTDYSMGVAGGRAGSARQRQNQGELSTKKDVLVPNKPLALHELIVRMDHF